MAIWCVGSDLRIAGSHVRAQSGLRRRRAALIGRPREICSSAPAPRQKNHRNGEPAGIAGGACACSGAPVDGTGMPDKAGTYTYAVPILALHPPVHGSGSSTVHLPSISPQHRPREYLLALPHPNIPGWFARRRSCALSIKTDKGGGEQPDSNSGFLYCQYRTPRKTSTLFGCKSTTRYCGIFDFSALTLLYLGKGRLLSHHGHEPLPLYVRYVRVLDGHGVS